MGPAPAPALPGGAPRWSPTPAPPPPPPTTRHQPTSSLPSLVAVVALTALALLACLALTGGVSPRTPATVRVHALAFGGGRTGARADLRIKGFDAAGPTSPEAPPPPPPLPSSPSRLPRVGLCAVVKDQGEDLAEFVDWHLALGASTAYIFDHNSSVPAVAALGPHVADGRAVVVRFARFDHPSGKAQLWAYDQCLTARLGGRGRAGGGALNGARARQGGVAPTPRAATPSHPWQRFGPTNDWLAFLDVDEFLVPRAAAAAAILADPSTARAFLPTLLAAHAGAAALAVHWVMFGTSGHVTRPAGGTLAAYTRCTRDGDPENSHVKSVVAPARTRRAGPDPHHFIYVPGGVAVNTRGETVRGERVEGAGGASGRASAVCVVWPAAQRTRVSHPRSPVHHPPFLGQRPHRPQWHVRARHRIPASLCHEINR